MLFRGKESKFRCEYIKQLRAALMKLEKGRFEKRSKRRIEQDQNEERKGEVNRDERERDFCGIPD